MTSWFDTEPPQCLKASFEVLPLLCLSELQRNSVAVRMMRDLMPLVQDLRHGIRPALGGDAGNEERRLHADLRQHIENARNPNLRFISLVAHDVWILRVSTPIGENRGFHINRKSERKDCRAFSQP